MAATVREFCREVYQRTIRNMPDIDPELRRKLKSHERVPKLIDNLARDLANVKATRDNVELAVRDVTRWFVMGIQLKAQQTLMSESQKLALRKKETEAEQFRKDVETYDEKGAMHVIKESESFEEIRADIGIKASEYDTDEKDSPVQVTAAPRKSSPNNPL